MQVCRAVFGGSVRAENPFRINGSPGWTRTNDQRINSPTLYRLSYRGTERWESRKGANSEARAPN